MKKNIRKARGFTLVELMIVVAIVGILAALAIFGVKKYVTNSKTAEARNTIGQISKDAAGAWSRELMAGSILSEGASVAGANILCAASTTVPADFVPKGAKYQSKTTAGDDYNSGDSKTGWVCLHFMMEGPQYFQYQYTNATAKTFSAVAVGDLNGDGKTSQFSRDGAVSDSGQIILAPAIVELNPDE